MYVEWTNVATRECETQRLKGSSECPAALIPRRWRSSLSSATRFAGGFNAFGLFADQTRLRMTGNSPCRWSLKGVCLLGTVSPKKRWSLVGLLASNSAGKTRSYEIWVVRGLGSRKFYVQYMGATVKNQINPWVRAKFPTPQWFLWNAEMHEEWSDERYHPAFDVSRSRRLGRVVTPREVSTQ